MGTNDRLSIRPLAPVCTEKPLPHALRTDVANVVLAIARLAVTLPPAMATGYDSVRPAASEWVLVHHFKW